MVTKLSSNCDTCKYRQLVASTPKEDDFGHCYMFFLKPDGHCLKHTELPIRPVNLAKAISIVLNHPE